MLSLFICLLNNIFQPLPQVNVINYFFGLELLESIRVVELKLPIFWIMICFLEVQGLIKYNISCTRMHLSFLKV